MKLIRQISRSCIMVCASFYLSTPLSAAETAQTTLEVQYSDVGCTHSSCASLRSFCKSKLPARAVRACLKKGHSGKVTEIENSYDYDCGTAGNCQSAPGVYTSFACGAFFRCD